MKLPPALLLPVLLAAGCSPAAPAPGPDVLLISLDAVRADDLSFRDPERTPNLTALAARGTVFTQAIAGTSWTLPSHAQIFTGQPPLLHGVQTDDAAIDPLTPTLPEILRQRGYLAFGLWTGWYLAGDYGFERGFVSYENAMTDGELGQSRLREALEGSRIPEAWSSIGQREKSSHEDVTSANVAERAGEIVAGLDPDDRLLLFAHFFDPHYDFVPPGEWARRFDPDYRGEIDGRDYWANPRVADPRTGQRVVGERDLQHLRALYRGEIGWTDEQIGALLEHLRRAGRLENTLIVVTSDHGEEFFEHGRRGHKQSLYDEVLRVPLLIVLPESMRRDPPTRVDAQVSLSDLLPTLLDLTGIETPESVWGRSLRPALEGQSIESRPLVASMSLYDSRSDGSFFFELHECLRTPEHKLWRISRVDQSLRPELRFLVYFDLAADPLERRGMGGDPAEWIANPSIRQAWDRLEEELAALRAHHAALEHSPDSERLTDMARLLGSELQGLGYVGDWDEGGESPARKLPWGLGMRPPVEAPTPR